MFTPVFCLLTLFCIKCKCFLTLYIKMINANIDISLDVIRSRVKNSTWKKIVHSIEILQKGEKLAKAYDPNNGYWVGMSGGKDSMCVYHLCKLANVSFIPFTNVTTVDPPETIKFIRREYPDSRWIKAKISIYKLSVKKKLLPNRFQRTCCNEYKENTLAGVVKVMGIRHEESTKRGKRNTIETSDFRFSGTSYGQLDHYREEMWKRTNKRKFKDQKRVPNQQGEMELGCIHGKETLIVNPIIYWKEFQVWDFLTAIGAKHNPLYDREYSRVGCICCPLHSNIDIKLHEIDRYPHVAVNWLRAIKKIYNKKQYIHPLFYNGANFQLEDDYVKNFVYLRIFAVFLISKPLEQIESEEVAGVAFQILGILKEHNIKAL